MHGNSGDVISRLGVIRGRGIRIQGDAPGVQIQMGWGMSSNSTGGCRGLPFLFAMAEFLDARLRDRLKAFCKVGRLFDAQRLLEECGTAKLRFPASP